MLNNIESNKRYEMNLYKNKVFLTGSASVVERYYKEDITAFEDKYEQSARAGTFWHNVGAKNARVLFGLVKMINDAFVRLVTSGGFELEVLGEDGEIDEEETERLKEILRYNDFEKKKWGLAESFASGLGFSPIKVSIDEDIGDKPIIEVIDPFKIEAIEKRGFIIGYKLKRRQKIEDEEYEVQEIIYMDDGKPIIEYKLLDINNNSTPLDIGKFRESNSKAFDELGLSFLIRDNKVLTVFDDMSELKDMPIVVKNNTPYNSSFPKSPFGEPDTQELDLFEDSLSEMISNMVEEVRKGRIKVAVSEDLIPKDAEGRALGFDEFKTEYIKLGKDKENNQKLVEIIQGEINTEKYLSGIAQLIMHGCNKANIHPITVGITGVESIVASQESQVEREKVSLRTRETKLASWRESLKKLFNVVLQTDDIIKGKEVDDYEINVSFGEFTNPSPDSIIGLMGKAVENGLTSMRQAQKDYQKEMGMEVSKDDMERNYLYTLVEKGQPLSNAQNLRFEELTQEDIDESDE